MTHADALMLIGILFYLTASQHKENKTNYVSLTVAGVLFFILAGTASIFEVSHKY